MPTVIAGASQTISIAVGEAYRVSIADGSDAYVDLLSGAPGSPYASPRLRAPKTDEIFGPYPSPAQIRLRVNAGSATYAAYVEPKPVTATDSGDLYSGGRLLGSVSGAGKRVYRPGMALIANPSNMADYTVGGSPSVAQVVTRPDGRKAIRLVTNGANTCDIQVPIKNPRAFSGRASLTVEYPVPADWAGGGVSLQLAVDGAYVNRMVFTNSYGNDNLFFGRNNYAPQRIGQIQAPTRWLEWDGFGTVPDDATMHSTVYNFARIRFTPKAGSTGSECFFYGAWVDEMDESPSLIITTDDCDATVHTLALPILERYGLRCTFGFMEDKVAAGGLSMTDAQCKDAFARGHNFNTHGCKTGFNSYRDYNKDKALIKADMDYNRAGLIRRGLARNGSENIIIYPQGYFRASADYNDTTIIDAAKELGFQGGRIASFQGGRVEPISWADARFVVPVLGHYYNYSGNETNNISDIIDRQTKTIEDGLSYPTMWHVFTTLTPGNDQTVNVANFERFCEAAAYLCSTGKAVNRTLDEHIYRCNNAMGIV